MNLKEIFNIEQDIQEDNVIIKAISYYFNEDEDFYNLVIDFNIYIKDLNKDKGLSSYLEFVSNSQNVIEIKVLFKNAANFSVKNLYRDTQVTGFEIIEHKQNGWEIEKKYEIRDFEEDKINLFCQEIKLLK